MIEIIDVQEAMKMKVKLDEWGICPKRQHPTDAGLDIYSPVDVTIGERDSIVINTGVHIELPKGTVGMLKSRSGININHGIVSEGVIDEGYTGSIHVKLYNHSDTAYKVKRGDRITQLVVMECYFPDVELVEELEHDNERGNNGIGSTGR